ncbi:PQ loop repeat family protein [Acanthamoeba castellanii str. Neff]|uniref:PQ loop repeat family protein n=1 Tax=Acanthamoeba castellanii (strain ATCC 30010 / Neff) TaxID=1257118 RepID=L8H5Y5_ACACF|nr:PQ loop repeat family protein [Acanthamoeba castellanii str. Neff]ELR20560.1 PQ loop repeat family protein [Acanthamoeba castellanii str. Neff]
MDETIDSALLEAEVEDTFDGGDPSMALYNSAVLYAQIAGTIATLLFSVQYLPQTYLNYKRKSVTGFSVSGIIIKLVGSCFLIVNAWASGETWPVVMYGLCNTIQHSIFCVQFSIYKNNPNYSLWLFFLLVPALLCGIFPGSMVFTNSIKPITQVISHFPQLQECFSARTTGGVSLMSQLFNLFGGILGVYMCWVIPAKSPMTILLYINSMFQALSLFALYFLFDFGRSPKQQLDPAGPAHEKATVYMIAHGSAMRTRPKRVC